MLSCRAGLSATAGLSCFIRFLPDNIFAFTNWINRLWLSVPKNERFVTCFMLNYSFCKISHRLLKSDTVLKLTPRRIYSTSKNINTNIMH